MNQLLSNTDRVKEIKRCVFSENIAPEELSHLIDPQAIIESQANFDELTGAKGLSAVIQYWRHAFPNVKSTWVETEENNETVLINWQAEAIHTGDEFFGITAKGNPVTYSGKTTYQFNDSGKLIRYQSAIDIDAIKVQLAK